MSVNKKPRVLALYLPQFHPIPENDAWWGKGFTEWFNVGKAKALYKGHYQPRVPTELGYYDLRVPETRKAQAELARSAGIEGFCYWHYWFGNGKELLERPFNEVLGLGEPDFPFCLAWANESWRGFYHGLSNERNMLIEQTYPGETDHIDHFYRLLPAFKDPRYITVAGKPFFMIYKPHQLPDPEKFIEIWNALAKENGFEGFHFVCQVNNESDIRIFRKKGFSGVYLQNFFTGSLFSNICLLRLRRLIQVMTHKPCGYPYARVIQNACCKAMYEKGVYPGLLCDWDHTPRTGYKGIMVSDFSIDKWKNHVQSVLECAESKGSSDNFVIIKSWNEWAEGNYLEPDLMYGNKKLEVLSDLLNR